MVEDYQENYISGWIKLHRSIINHWIFKDEHKLKAWICILCEVNHKPKKIILGNKLLNCDRGESLKSLDTWAKLFGSNWNKSKVRRFFKLLEDDNMIVTKNENKTTRLTVRNYSTYQDNRNDDETQVKRKRNASETQTTPNKNDKNIKNDNNDDDGVYINIDILMDNYLKDERTINAVLKNGLKGKTLNNLKTLLEEFNQHLKSNGTHLKTKPDYAKHFLSWSKKQKSIKGHRNILKTN